MAAMNMNAQKPRFELVCGEALDVMRHMPDGCVDAVITDPPYSSGGFTRDDKMQDTGSKYIQNATARQYPSFGGDSRDQRSYLAWCALWIDQCMRLLKPSGYFLAFSDWRQLPVMSDALQCGGVFWRGIVAWDKGRGSRAPHKGYFRHQCEYVLWGTKGKAAIATHAGPFDGCIHAPVLQSDKHHMTGKPTSLMRELVAVAPPDALIFDPFAGSGSTGVAALLTGRRFVGIERERAYADIATTRLEQASRAAAAQPAELGAQRPSNSGASSMTMTVCTPTCSNAA